MAIPVTQTSVVSQFSCIGDACPDTCCKGWGMQLSEQDVVRYRTEAPELLESVTSGEADFIMKRDAATDYCVKFENGWCGIHAAYGDRMLGDACHFFPRVTRSLGGRTVMTASMACPEIARMTLTMDAPCDAVEGSIERVPHSLKEYGAAELPPEAMWKVHQAFLAHGRTEGAAPERVLAQIASVVRSIALLPVGQWEAAVPFYLRMADGRLPVPEAQAVDPFHLLNALQGLVGAANVSDRPRLTGSIECISRVLEVSWDPDMFRVDISEASPAQYLRMQAFWREHCQAYYAPVLLRWLEGQLSLSLFPFAGLGRDMEERITVLMVRFATLRLALMAHCFEAQAVLADDVLVRVVQGLSRFLDHLADPHLSMQIYAELGWTREARARALVGDQG